MHRIIATVNLTNVLWAQTQKWATYCLMSSRSLVPLDNLWRWLGLSELHYFNAIMPRFQIAPPFIKFPTLGTWSAFTETYESRKHHQEQSFLIWKKKEYKKWLDFKAGLETFFHLRAQDVALHQVLQDLLLPFLPERPLHQALLPFQGWKTTSWPQR